MSTRFTKRGVPLVESRTLQLIQSTTELNDVIAKHLTQRLVELGYQSITPSLLSFLSVLECGVNYGSEIARNLGVTRQMVAKTVKELCRLGYLEQVDGVGKQKEILFTENGEYLMSDARRALSDVDGLLFKNLEDKKAPSIIEELNTLTKTLDETLDK